MALPEVIHSFDLRRPGDLDAEIRSCLREAYDLGCQRHRIPTT